jgi:type IV pilus assembly protein PilA
MFQSVLRRVRDAQSAEFEGGAAAEAGFTLIELMVVLLIIAILLAIAIPTFLGVTGSANDRAAQSNLTNALTEASAAYQSNNQTFQGIAAMATSAPEFTWLASNVAATAGNNISEYPVDLVASGDAQGVILAAYSKSGACWYVAQLSATPTTIATTGFDQAASGNTGYQTGATTGGTYYAEQKPGQTGKNPATDCNAKYPETESGGFTWGPSYSAAGQD